MTTVTLPSSDVRPAHAWRPRWQWLRRSFEFVALLTLFGFLIFDRVRLFQEYLTKFIDEDQGIEWYAARELLHGRFHEPCFFGQAYNSNLEGYLSAPLVFLHVPYRIAVPAATVFLSLLPFVLIAAVGFLRRQSVAAALALLAPIALSTRYGILTGMPRGFVTGLAVASLSAILFLPAERGKKPAILDPSAPPRAVRARRSHPKRRYFLAGFLAVIGLMLNPNCAILLAAVAVYALCTSWREWRFWVFSFLGLTAAATYPAFAYYFYNTLHPDYAIYPPPSRLKTFIWTWKNFWAYVHSFCNAGFDDLVPRGLTHAAEPLFQWAHTHWPGTVSDWLARNPAPGVLAALFAGLLLLFLLRLRLAAFLAGVAGIGLTIASFAWGRIHDGRTSVSFDYARMFLAIPVLWLWLCLLIGPEKRWRLPAFALSRWRIASACRFMSRAWHAGMRWAAPAVRTLAIAAIACAGAATALAKSRALPKEVQLANEHAEVARPVPISDLDRIARAVREAEAKEHISFVLIEGYNGRKWDYALPAITHSETLFPSFERRTWRLVEECYPRYEKILLLGKAPGRRASTFNPTVISRDPPLTMYTLHGYSVIDFCKAADIHVRSFKAPHTPPPPPLPPPPRAKPRPAHPAATAPARESPAATRSAHARRRLPAATRP